jgi:transcriptional regulator with XRE-family HTH domain
VAIADAAEGGSTAQRMVLGSELRRLREANGISRGDAGKKIRGSESKISRMELGRVALKVIDVEDLLTLYDVTDEEQRADFLKMVEESNQPGWWVRFGELVPKWFHNYVGLEESAARIQTFEMQFIPGLLQTESYARAVISRAHPDAAPEEINRRVNVRMRRQRLLSRPRAPRVWAVLDEGALKRMVGNKDIMREQLENLQVMSQQPTIAIQVVPFNRATTGAEVPFSLLRFAHSELSDIVYIEYPTGALYLDKPAEVEMYVKVTHRLTAEAATPEESREIIKKAQLALDADDDD